MHDIPTGDSTADAAARVLAVRRRQIARAGKLNSRISVRELPKFCQPDAAAEKLFWQSQSHLGMSARSYHHLLRVARTIADLDMSDVIRMPHVAEALQLRRALDVHAATGVHE
jgi:magnesium chelatase family protein